MGSMAISIQHVRRGGQWMVRAIITFKNVENIVWWQGNCSSNPENCAVNLIGSRPKFKDNYRQDVLNLHHIGTNMEWKWHQQKKKVDYDKCALQSKTLWQPVQCTGMCTWLSRHFKSWPHCCEDIAEGYFYLRHHYHFSPELLQQNPLTPISVSHN